MSVRGSDCVNAAWSDVLAQILDRFSFLIDNGSRIHDNGCGAGDTTTSAILEHCQARAIHAPLIAASDSSATSIAAVQTHISQVESWSSVNAAVSDPNNLAYNDETFSLTVCNSRIARLSDPLKALREMHRTLQFKGVAIVTCWKSGIPDIYDAAFKAVNVVQPAVVLSTDAFSHDGHLVRLVEEAGWERGKIKPFVISTTVKHGDLDHLIQSLSSSFAEERANWSDEDNTKWCNAIERTVQNQKTAGGLSLEAWVVLAKKWDQLVG